MEYILSSLDMFAGVSDNLINYTFNVNPDRSSKALLLLRLTRLLLISDDILRNERGHAKAYAGDYHLLAFDASNGLLRK